MLLKRTRAVADELMADIKKLLFYTTIVVQCIFFVLYGYLIYSNLNKIIFLVTYSILFILAIIYFVNYLVTYKKENKNKKFSRCLRIFKYVVNGSMLCVNIFELVKFGVSDFNKVLLFVSAISLFIQILFEFVRVMVERYVELFIYAVKLDFKFLSPFSKLKKSKVSLDVPLDNKEIKQPVLSNEERVEKEVERLVEQFENKKKDKKKQNSDNLEKNQKQQVINITAKKKTKKNIETLENKTKKKQTTENVVVEKKGFFKRIIKA